MEMIGIECRIAELPEDISQEEFEDAFCKINKDPEVHGILLFQPLPEQLDVEKIRQMIDPAKDMDGMSPVNLAKIFEGDRTAYAPCTSEAVMHIMNHLSLIHILTGFLDGINDSLKVANPIETMDEDTEVSLAFDKELLYKNMVDAKADWLYELPQWDKIFTEEKKKVLYKEQKNARTIHVEKKVYPNDPCPCGSGKKYKKCCGKNK